MYIYYNYNVVVLLSMLACFKHNTLHDSAGAIAVNARLCPLSSRVFAAVKWIR